MAHLAIRSGAGARSGAPAVRRTGLGVTLNDTAHHAGVGVGTVYRRFPEKELLADTLFQERLDEWGRLFEDGLADPDRWHAVITVRERARG